MPRPTDRWYTQGIELNYLSAPIAAGGSDWLLPAAAPDAKVQTRRFEILIGQSIFTPENLHLNPPDSKDRPYAGWLYGGWGLYQENDHRSLQHLRLLVGVVGPGALAQRAQDGFHVLLREAPNPGWAFQLKDEPGLVFSYERKWRLDLPAGAGLSIDAIPEVGASLGNVFTYAELGALVRLGQNLKADYGPARIQPALSGTPWFDPSQLEGAIGWYVFGGAQVRATARNIFLDGNTFASSPKRGQASIHYGLVGWSFHILVGRRQGGFCDHRAKPGICRPACRRSVRRDQRVVPSSLMMSGGME